MRILCFWIASFILFGCDSSTQSEADSPGLYVALAKCEGQAAKVQAKAPEPKRGELLFISSDSISFLIRPVLNCEAKYAFSAVASSPDTLQLEARDIGESRAKCVCEKEMTIQFKAMNGEDFEGIRAVKFFSQVYLLSSE